jgi:hypothetical protein
MPESVMFGQAFPKIRMVMRGGRQYFESTTNDQLHITPRDFTDAGTLTMAWALDHLGQCEEAHEACEEWCPLLSEYHEVTDEDTGEDWSGYGLYTKGRLDFTRCPGIVRLRDHCQTEPQRRFFDLWCEANTKSLKDDWLAGEEWADDKPYALSFLALQERLGFPALLPEVWLNYLGPEKTADDELHLSENPSRVDFVLFAKGRKCVIEIDGKSHYADYNRETNRWTPDERLYTRNLKIERSLRRQGWEIYRFSDLEVNTVTLDGFGAMIRLLPTDVVPF